MHKSDANMNNMNRRSFIKNAGMATAALSAMPVGLTGCRKGVQDKLMLMRYDTEWWGEPEGMAGFLEFLVCLMTLSGREITSGKTIDWFMPLL